MQLEKDEEAELRIINAIRHISNEFKKEVSLMEVCGTHTVSIFKHGIRSLLPESIRLISGPGCPVCVTPPEYIDQAAQLAREEDVIICSFGDMIRVPGLNGTLENARAQGAEIRVVYSPLDCLDIAKMNPQKAVIFLAVGFETTSPVIGLALKRARGEAVNNFFVLPGLKLLFPALEALFGSGEVSIDGLICPGHVSAVTGEKPYKFLPEKYKLPCVVTGFERVDILRGIYMLMLQIAEGRAEIENAYKRAGTIIGNAQAIKIIGEVFEKSDDSWRGLGLIPSSGLEPAGEYKHMNARTRYSLGNPTWVGDGACSCGDVIKGLKIPRECPLFKKVCTPLNPIGACMVSMEGSCAAYYKYG